MSQKQVPDWSLQLTEQLMQRNETPSRISPLPPSAVIIHDDKDKQDNQFGNYLDKQFNSTVLKNRLSDAPSHKPSELTLRDSQQTQFWSDINDLNKKPELQKEKYKSTDFASRHYTDTYPHHDEEHNAWWVASFDEDGFYSVPGLLFLFGFLIPPLWWVGSFWPRHVREHGGKMAERWQKLNRIMSIGFSTILVIAIIVVAILYATKRT
jgi:hypothetical protein